MIRLKHGKFIYGAKIYRCGDILPDTASAKLLVNEGRAEIIENIPKKRNSKKLNPEKPAEIPNTTPKNVEVNP